MAVNDFHRTVTLSAPQDLTVSAELVSAAGLSNASTENAVLETVYVDAEDLCLTRAHITLQHVASTSGGVWTLSLPRHEGHGDADPIVRTFAGEIDTVPAAARDLIRARVRSRRLRRVLRVHTTRTCVPLIDADGQQVAMLADDHIEVFSGRRHLGAGHEIGIDLPTDGKGTRDLRRAVTRSLKAAGCRPLDADAVQRVLDARIAEAGGSDTATAATTDHPSIAEVLQHALGSSLARLLEHDPGVRLGLDAEDVHQFRVAARTMRSDLKTFNAVLDGEWADVLRAELGWLGEQVGRARDLDVLTARLQSQTRTLDGQDADGVVQLMRVLAAEHQAAHTTGLAALRCHRFDSLLDMASDAAESPRFAEHAHDAASRSAKPFVRAAARRQFLRLERSVAKAGDHATDADLHAIRIRTKRTRYAMDAAATVIGRPASRHAAALAQLQGVLGDLQDTVVARQWLRDTATANPSCALVAGQLIANERATHDQLREQWHSRWRDASNHDIRAWL